MKMSRYLFSVILGLPWLCRHNPEIDWNGNTIAISSNFCIRNCIFAKIAVAVVEEEKAKKRERSPFSSNKSSSYTTPATSRAPSPKPLPSAKPTTPYVFVNAAAFKLLKKERI
jgi:hypothetical protein